MKCEFLPAVVTALSYQLWVFSFTRCGSVLSRRGCSCYQLQVRFLGLLSHGSSCAESADFAAVLSVHHALRDAVMAFHAWLRTVRQCRPAHASLRVARGLLDCSTTVLSPSDRCA